jgi:hypothetical protein
MKRRTLIALGIAAVVVLAVGLGFVIAQATRTPGPATEGDKAKGEQGQSEQTKAGADQSAGQPQSFEDLAVGETATFQNGLELTLTDAGIVTTPTTPPETDSRGNPKAGDPRRVLQNMHPPGTEFLAFRFNATMNGPEGVMPARIEGALNCRDSNGVVLPPFTAHDALRSAIRADAGLSEQSRQSAPAQQLSGSPIENGQSREALLICEKPEVGGDVEAGVRLRAQPGNTGPGASWTVTPEDLEALPPDKI